MPASSEAEPQTRERGGSPNRASSAALIILVLLVVVSPWPIGGVSPLAVWLLSLAMLASALVVVLAQAYYGPCSRPDWPLWPVGGVLVLATLQLVLLPPGLHSWLAPGSAAFWHPTEPAPATVLGSGFRPVSIDPEATRRWLGFTAGVMAVALLAVPALRNRRRALGAALVVVASGLAVAVYGVVARTLFGPLLFGRLAVPTVSPFGPFVSKNHFAGYVEMAALLGVGLAVGLADEARRRASSGSWMQSPRAGRAVFAFGTAGAMSLAVLISLSRGGTTSLAAGGFVFAGLRLLVRQPRRGRGRTLGAAAAITIALAAAILVVLPSEARDRVLSVAGITSDRSGAFRLGLWRDTVRLAASSPFLGLGQGTFADALPRFKTAPLDLRAEHAENDYLELFADGGALALLLALLTVGLGARHLVKGLREQHDRLMRGLGLGAGAGLSAVLVHSSFDFNLRIPSNALLFAFLAALALAASAGERRVGKKALLLAALALMATLLANARPPSSAEYATQVQEVSRLLEAPGPVRLRWSQANAALTARLQRRPADAEGWVMLGWIRALRGDRAEGAALARYGAGLDPQRTALRVEADRLARLVKPRGN